MVSSPTEPPQLPLPSKKRIAAARLGMPLVKRKLSIAASSSGDSMICSRTSRAKCPLWESPTDHPYDASLLIRSYAQARRAFLAVAGRSWFFEGVQVRNPIQPPRLARGVSFHLSSLIKSAFFCVTCSIVHCPGDLSGRKRKSDVPCRKRSPEKWS